MSVANDTVCERLDPRIRRTRQMLREALERLLRTKVIEQISVLDIAEAATLNRATFYDHYSDKFALLESLVESQFEELIERRGIVFDGTCSKALMGITMATCEYLSASPGLECPNAGPMDKHFEPAIMSVLRGMILGGLRQHSPPSKLPSELIAAVIGGAIYAGAKEWVRTPGGVPVTEAAESIYSLVGPIMAAA